MKNIFFVLLFFWVFSFAEECPVTPEIEGPVSYYGKLKVRQGYRFIDGIGEQTIRNVQVRGVSFFWSQWSDFYNENAVERMAVDWKAELVRAAYSPTNVSLSNNAVNLDRVKTVIEAAIKNDVYVIIDWHSHYAHDEVTYAKEFFEEMAKTYGSCDNVIFELYNEPYTNTVWATIKDYAEKVIPEIREYSDNLILVGTETWSQKVEDVVGNAIDDANVGYVFHFYAASHSLNNFQSNIDKVLNNGLPVFVTEYGTTHADGGCSPIISNCSNGDMYNSHNINNSNRWHTYMDSKLISSAAWSIADKYEGSAFFGTVPREAFDQSVDANWSDTTKMTASGKYIFNKLNCYYLSAPWNPNPDPSPEDSPYCIQTAGSTTSLSSTPQFNGLFNFELIGSSLAVNLPSSGNTVFEVFSLQGKKVGELFNGYQNAGNFQISLENLNLKNGVYIFKLRQNSVVQTKSLKIVK